MTRRFLSMVLGVSVLLATLMVAVAPAERGLASGTVGCHPRYWKDQQHVQTWPARYKPSDPFRMHFENAFPGKNLMQVLRSRGGGLNELGRHAVAALLNAAYFSHYTSPFLVPYWNDETGTSPKELVRYFNWFYPNTDAGYAPLTRMLKRANRAGCPQEATSTAEEPSRP